MFAYTSIPSCYIIWQRTFSSLFLTQFVLWQYSQNFANILSFSCLRIVKKIGRYLDATMHLYWRSFSFVCPFACRSRFLFKQRKSRIYRLINHFNNKNNNNANNADNNNKKNINNNNDDNDDDDNVVASNITPTCLIRCRMYPMSLLLIGPY